MSHFVMLQRNLLYTGVTRAKKILVLVGEKKAVYYAIKMKRQLAEIHVWQDVCSRTAKKHRK